MEMTYEEWKAAKRDLRRHLSVPGWTLLVYYAIMNAAVAGWVFVETLARVVQGTSIGNAAAQSAESAWGYFLAAAVGFAILLLWKKPRFFREEIFAKGAPMKAGSFFAILCVFLGAQMVYQVCTTLLELLLNAFGYTMTVGMQSLQTDPDNFSMFLYAGILAPIAEEILFRGVIQRTLMPFGKKFAIFVSALTFGLFHGNLIQAPYAFAVGLVLGYVAAEYSVIWSMVLHMINNLLLADMLYRLLGALPEEAVSLIVWVVIFSFTVAAVIILIVKRKEIAAWHRSERMVGAYLGCYFSSPGTITMLIILGLNILLTTFMMITPYE